MFSPLSSTLKENVFKWDNIVFMYQMWFISIASIHNFNKVTYFLMVLWTGWAQLGRSFLDSFMQLLEVTWECSALNCLLGWTSEMAHSNADSQWWQLGGQLELWTRVPAHGFPCGFGSVFSCTAQQLWEACQK